ncbi:MAG: hypothetical protein KDE28_03100, partial [Anaerolineales bacterium]|nr:hypothetical protein [Anaerolineales bacterium]
LLVVGPLLAGLLLSFLRRWPRVLNGVGAVLALILWRLLDGLTLADANQSVWFVLGREMQLVPAQLEAFKLAAAGLTILLLLCQVAPAGPLFAPLSLALFSPLAAAAMISPSLFAPPALLVAIAMVAGLIQAGQAGSTQGSLRFLGLMLFTVPLLLLFTWLIDSGQADGLGASRLVLLALLVILAGFPFHIWVAPTVIQAPPLATVYIFSLLQLMLLVALPEGMMSGLQNLLDSQLLTVLAWSGGITALLGGILAWQAVTFSQLWAYVLLIDLGAGLIVLASGEGDLLLLLGVRFVTLTLGAVGLSSLRQEWPEEEGKGLRPVSTHGVLGMVLFSYSLISLVGLPLTLGYLARWHSLEQGLRQSSWLAILLVTAGGLAMVGIARFLTPIWAMIWQQRRAAEGGVTFPSKFSPENWVQGGLILLGLILAFLPHWLIKPLSLLLNLL